MTIRVYPGAKNPSHQISLSDGVQTFGLRLENGPHSVEEIPLTPSTVQFTGGGSKFGDWEPGISHIEQRTWQGGRANHSFVDDATRYSDAKNAWTLTPGKVFPAPAAKFSSGYLSEAHENLPGDLGWRSLYGDYADIAEPFSHTSGWATYRRVYLWVRCVGNPGDLTISILRDSSGAPSTARASAAISASDYNEHEIYLLGLDLDNANALVLTESWIAAISQASDDAANHWEIGVDIDGGTGYYRYQKNTWHLGSFSIYYRVSSAIEDRKFIFFEFRQALYAVDVKKDGGASNLYINGSRGRCTAASSTTITDSNHNWAADEWTGAWLKIIKGTGAGQAPRQITDNDATSLTVSPAFEITPVANDSFYVIYHTPIWKDITPASGDQFDGPVSDVAVGDNTVFFAMGQANPILKMAFSGAGSAHVFDDEGTNKANQVTIMSDATNGVQLYATTADALAADTPSMIKRAALTAWGTAMTFGAAFDVGTYELPITSLYAHNGKLYAWKPDGRYAIAPDDSVVKEAGDIGFVLSSNNGEAALSRGNCTYFSWGGYAIMRLSESSGADDLTSIGPDRDEGLPDDRKGRCVRLLGAPPGIIAAIQGDSYSSVLVLPESGTGWHEVYRGWASGAEIENIYLQDSHRPRLWISIGGELVYQDWPRHTFNPLKDAGICYQPEAHLVSSTIDMGVSRLPKLIKEISAAVENLSSDVEVHLDYQTNADVGTDAWVNAGVFQINPTDTLPINAGEVYQLRYRLRLVTKDERTPPIVNATVLEGFARTPLKYQWNLRLKISSTQRELSGISRDAEPDELISWLKEAAVNSRRILMRSIWEQMDAKSVVVEPPALQREFTNNVLGYWGGVVELRVREM